MMLTIDDFDPIPTDHRPVKVQANEYTYEGSIAGAVRKSTGIVRVVVEDAQGRLFIHNLDQISLRTVTPYEDRLRPSEEDVAVIQRGIERDEASGDGEAEDA